MQEPYRTIPKKLRDYGSKYASRIHGGKNLTSQHLKLLSRIALRQESDHFDAGDNYVMGDTESEDDSPESDHESDHEFGSVPEANGLKPQPDPQKSQTIEMDSILAEIDTMLAKI
ncbi:1624_t:CDS:2 [Funneliformis mosseae]|uniref:1624_t:CDS:1 n=1 Tax=Funneliformis mosseae TaxID=27381 RepID=A0A9N9BFW5_FUNMO|nr:1624_t:CDS:2 [Funneliformis mosseae]